MKDNIVNICWTVFGLGLCAVAISAINSCAEIVKNNEMVGLKQREACLEKAGSVLAGPNGTMQCLVLFTN